MASFSPPEAKRVKREKVEDQKTPVMESVDEPDAFYSFLVRGSVVGGRKFNLELFFDKGVISIDEPVRIATLAELSLIVHTADDKGEKRDLLSQAIVTTKEGGWKRSQCYKLRQHLYESTRLRLGHLLPADLIDQPICYVRWDKESRTERALAECTLRVLLTDVKREADMRRVCGMVPAGGGRRISCSREILGLYSSDPSIFVPHFTPVISDAAAAAVELHEVTMRLVNSRHWDEITNLSSLIEIVIKCQSYGFPSLLARYLDTIKWKQLRTQTTADMLRMAVACGESVDHLMEPYFARFKSVQCLHRIYTEHKGTLTPSVTRILFEAMFNRSQKAHIRPRICFHFKEGKVCVELVAEINRGQTRDFMQWLGQRLPEMRKKGEEEGLPFREAFPAVATVDPEDAEGRRLPIHGYQGRSAPIHPPAFYGEQTMMMEVMRESASSSSSPDDQQLQPQQQQQHALRFSRHCRQPIGLVGADRELIGSLTRLEKITVTDAVKYEISEKNSGNRSIYSLDRYCDEMDGEVECT